MPEPSPARLAVVFPHVVLGGGETAMIEVAASLAARYRLDVCALDNRPPSPEPTIRRLLAERFGEVCFARRPWQLRPRLAAADAVLWYGVVNTVPRLLAALPGRPASVRVVHSERPVEGLPFHRRWRRAIDATACVSPRVARQVPGAAFVPNPVAAARLAGGPRRLFPPGRPTLGFLGRLLPDKNVEWLIDHLAALGADLALQALDSELASAAGLARRAAERGVADRVRFLPPGDDVGTLLRSVDALVLPSRREAFPMVVVEAGWVGTPVVATRVGALPELFADEVLFVDDDGGVPRLDSLRRALATALSPAGRETGRRLAARVRTLCDPARVAARYAELIDGAIERRRERPAGEAAA
jgi:glycosyltransferase involved in cell wall biosynthesis